MAKSDLKIRSRVLRGKGESIKKIAQVLGVSSSSISVWCRDIKLTAGQIARLEKNSRDPFYGKRMVYNFKRKKEREEKEIRLRIEARKIIRNLNKREKLLVGTALYWAEGFKKDKMVGFSNTDPQMVKFVIYWLKHVLGVREELIRLRVVINEGHEYRYEEILKYWINCTAIPIKYFYKPTLQKVVWKKQYEHPEEYFGVLRIRVLRSTDLLRKIKGMIDSLSGTLDSNLM